MHGHLNVRLVNNDLVTTWKAAWAGHVARMGEKRNAYRVWVGKPEGKRPLGRPTRTLSIIFKRSSGKTAKQRGLDLSGSEQGKVAGSCENLWFL